MKLIEKLINGGVKDAVNSVGDAVDKIVTNDEERMEVKKELTEVITSFAQNLSSYSAEVLKIEMSGNWLQRSWRPIVMLAFAFIVCYEFFLSPVFGLPGTELPEQFWGLLEIGMGGYVIGRTVEKVADKVSSNLDKIPRKK
jgi:hypothetical protein